MSALQKLCCDELHHQAEVNTWYFFLGVGVFFMLFLISSGACLHPRPAVGVHLAHLVPDLLGEEPGAPLLLVPQHAGFPDPTAACSVLWKQVDVCKLSLQQQGYNAMLIKLVLLHKKK
jgi:1-acyl-sn-glycerol-3-phosphate acyltransferase